MNRALICGYYGSRNLGDEFMLSGMKELFRKHSPNLLLSVMSDDPQYTQNIHQIKAINRSRHYFYLPDILWHNYFVLGGGDLIRDSRECSIARIWLWYLYRAIQLRRKTLVIGVSVGEVWRSESKDFILKTLNKVNFLAVRGQESKERLLRLGVENTIQLMPDLALYNPLPKPAFEHSRIKVAISVRPLLGRSERFSSENCSRFQKTLAELIDFLHEQWKAEICFLPLQTFEENFHPDDDFRAIQEVISHSKYKENFTIYRSFGNLQDFLDILSKMNLVIGTRLHSVILASAIGTPVIAASYSSKVTSFMKEINNHLNCIEIETFSKEKVLPIIENLLANQEQQRNLVLSGHFDYRSRYQEFEKALSQILL